jgi:hypothetical protein
MLTKPRWTAIASTSSEVGGGPHVPKAIGLRHLLSVLRQQGVAIPMTLVRSPVEEWLRILRPIWKHVTGVLQLTNYARNARRLPRAVW